MSVVIILVAVIAMLLWRLVTAVERIEDHVRAVLVEDPIRPRTAGVTDHGAGAEDADGT